MSELDVGRMRWACEVLDERLPALRSKGKAEQKHPERRVLDMQR